MKSSNSENESGLAEILRKLAAQHTANQPKMPAPSLMSKPQQAPALYQDAGGGYNSNFKFPQR